MKIIPILLHKLKLHLSTNPLLLALFFLGGFVCTLSMVMMYGNTMPHMTRQVPEKYYRTFDVIPDMPTPAQTLRASETVKLALPRGTVEDILLRAEITQNPSLEPDSTLTIEASLHDTIFESFSSDAAFRPDAADEKQLILSHSTASWKQQERFELLHEACFCTFDLYENIAYQFCDYAAVVLLTDLAALLCMLPFLRTVMISLRDRTHREVRRT